MSELSASRSTASRNACQAGRPAVAEQELDVLEPPSDERDAPRATMIDVDSERIRRKPVPGGLINEYTLAA
jgi:hypothetical protein